MNETRKSQKKVSSRRAITFTYEDAPGKEVFLSGSFNNWQLTTQMNEYQYKFVVDGQWRLDGNNGCFAPNGFGELNSVLKVEPK